MNLNNLYTTLIDGIQNIAQEDDRISEDEFDDVLDTLEAVKKLVVK
ncbi:MAG TPA: hypothetical protein PKL77_07295 [Candidatus Omnitrophota bacterium]|nr:hypothetical protein [Candidatus Omnitrophota bacterium]